LKSSDVNIVDKTVGSELRLDLEKYELCEPLNPSEAIPHWYCFHHPCIAVHKKGHVQFSGTITYRERDSGFIQDRPLRVVPGKRTKRNWSPQDLVLPRKKPRGAGILVNSGESTFLRGPQQEVYEIITDFQRQEEKALEAINSVAVQGETEIEKRITAYHKTIREKDLERDRYWNWVAERSQADPRNDLYFIENTFLLLQKNPNFSDFFYNAVLHQAQPTVLGRFNFSRRRFLK
jgi:hypothetical protein